MPLQPADYVLLGLTVLLTVFGLIRGFSGVFAFLVGTSLSAASDVIGWRGFLSGINPVALRVATAVILFIAVFAVVRYVVKLIVGKLLSQPSDSIFGVCLGLFSGAFILWVLASSPDLRAYSYLAQEVHVHLR